MPKDTGTSNHILFSGYLKKLSRRKFVGWQTRFLVLTVDTLAYYKLYEGGKKKLCGGINLDDVKDIADNEGSFTVTVSDRDYVFKTASVFYSSKFDVESEKEKDSPLERNSNEDDMQTRERLQWIDNLRRAAANLQRKGPRIQVPLEIRAPHRKSFDICVKNMRITAMGKHADDQWLLGDVILEVQGVRVNYQHELIEAMHKAREITTFPSRFVVEREDSDARNIPEQTTCRIIPKTDPYCGGRGRLQSDDSPTMSELRDSFDTDPSHIFLRTPSMFWQQSNTAIVNRDNIAIADELMIHNMTTLDDDDGVGLGKSRKRKSNRMIRTLSV